MNTMIGATIGIIVTYLFYKLSMIGARPVYQMRGIKLIGPDVNIFPNYVDIMFKGKTVDRLNKTKIVFWNAGKALINAVDIVNPIVCDFSEGSRILEVIVIKRTRDTNKFSATVDSDLANRVLLNFVYLEPGDGAVIEILHTASILYPKITGTIKGVPRGPLDWGRIQYKNLNLFPSYSHIFKSDISFFIILLLISSSFGILIAGIYKMNMYSIVSGSLYIIMNMLLLWPRLRRFPKKLETD